MQQPNPPSDALPRSPLLRPEDWRLAALRTVAGPMANYVSAVLAMEVAPLPPTEVALFPHDAQLLTVRLTRRERGMESADGHGLSVHFSSLRTERGVSHPQGDCVTLFALLTPAGATKVLGGQALGGRMLARTAVADLVGRRSTAQLEDQLVDLPTPEAKCDGLLRWIERSVCEQRCASPYADRTARAAHTLAGEPHLSIEDVASREGLTRRQLERDFREWLAVTPKQFARTARLQRAARLARRGLPLAQVALEAGYADQPHMTRAINQLTGLTPTQLLRPPAHAMAAAFRDATGGGLAYG